MALVAGILLASPGKDREPAYTMMNFKDGILSVFNAQHQVILAAPWSRIWSGLDDPRNIETSVRQVHVVRREGTQANILVTSLLLGGDPGGTTPHVVRFMNGAGDELLSLPSPSGHIRLLKFK
jgi:hypothetical protein